MSDGSAVAPALATTSDHQHYIIDEVMPANSVHLLSGFSGVGTTTVALQMLSAIAHGEPIFERATYPAPFYYVDCGRAQDVFRRTLDRMGLAYSDIPFICLPSRPERERATIRSVIDTAISSVPGLRLLVIDGLNKLVPSGRHNDPAVISDFMGELNYECEHRHITILGIGPTAKTKDGETYADVRARFAGSVEWGKGADLIMHLERASSKMSDPRRTLTIMPLNAPTLVLDWSFDRLGKLFDCGAGMGDALLAQWLEQQTPGALCTTQQLLGIAAQCRVSRATLYRWAKDNLDDGGRGGWLVRPRRIQ